MFLKFKSVQIALTLFLILSLGLVALADTIRLKNGSIVKGKVIGFQDGKFVVLIGETNRQRQVTFYIDEIESIDFDTNNLPSNVTRVTNSGNSNRTSETNTSSNTNSNSNSNANKSPVSNPNVIVVGGNRNSNSNSNTAKTPVTSNSGNSNSRPANNNVSSGGSQMGSTTVSKTKPIVVNVKVLADNTSNGWSNSGWVVRKGQKIRISGTGRISLGSGRFSTPEGVKSIVDNEKLIKSEATGGLIAVIGDDNNEFIFIGTAREFIAQRDGVLFLGVNESNIDDNTGAYDVTVEIDPVINK